jgi:transposase
MWSGSSSSRTCRSASTARTRSGCGSRFGAWSTVSNRFRQWRDAGVFEALLEGVIAEAARRGEVDLSLVSVDSTTVRAHHDAAGMHLDSDTMNALEKAADEAEQARQKGEARKNKAGRTAQTAQNGRSGDESDVDASSD